MQGREEEPLTEPLGHPAHHDVPGSELRYVRDDEGEHGANRHGYHQKPFRSVSLGYGPRPDLGHDVSPEERREDYTLIRPVVCLKTVNMSEIGCLIHLVPIVC